MVWGICFLLRSLCSLRRRVVGRPLLSRDKVDERRLLEPRLELGERSDGREVGEGLSCPSCANLRRSKLLKYWCNRHVSSRTVQNKRPIQMPTVKTRQARQVKRQVMNGPIEDPSAPRKRRRGMMGTRKGPMFARVVDRCRTIAGPSQDRRHLVRLEMQAHTQRRIVPQR